jgi:hypothetical protein
MKNIIQISLITIFGTLIFSGCDENDDVNTPSPATSASSFSASFLLAHASPDAPTLDFIVNGVKVGQSVSSSTAQATYNTIALTAPGSLGTNLGNTNIRVRGADGSIGGILGAGDAVFRANNQNLGNSLFAAVNGARYTVFALDSISRPRPVRTFNANNNNLADVTYFNPLTGLQISRSDFEGITSSAVQARCIPLGARTSNAINTPVPAGNTDAGGVRFFLIQDFFPTDATFFQPINTTRSAIRFVHAAPITQGVYVWLVPTAGAPILIAGTVGTPNTPVNYVMQATANNAPQTTGNFNPSVGSRTQTVTASNFPIFITGSASTIYSVVVTTGPAVSNGVVLTVPNVSFTPGKIYTIYADGIVGKTGPAGLGAGIILHN